MKRDNTPGEWQEEVNQWGGKRRFRMVGGIKEYEMQIKTAGGASVPESRLNEYNRKNSRQYQDQQQKDAFCPFKGSTCRRGECAIFDGQSCKLSQIGKAVTDTQGKSCPFSPYQCRSDCGLYHSGCVLTAERIV